jgi:hypothetical protein
MPSFEVAPSKATTRKGGTHPERGIAGYKASSAAEGEKRRMRKSDQSTPDEWVESWTSIEGMKGRRTRYLCVAYLSWSISGRGLIGLPAAQTGDPSGVPDCRSISIGRAVFIVGCQERDQLFERPRKEREGRITIFISHILQTCCLSL